MLGLQRKRLRRRLWGRPGLVFGALRLCAGMRAIGVPVQRVIAPGWLLPDRMVSAGTVLVIEGFPRSANTFAEVAFRMAQPGPVSLAHHLHLPAQIVGGARRGIPTLVIVRDPADAVISARIRNPDAVLLELLRDWISFHEHVSDWASHCVVARFDEVVTDFGAVIRRVNDRFACEFGLFAHDRENVERVFAEIVAMNAARFGGGRVVETMVARPSATRAKPRAELQTELCREVYRDTLARGRGLYRVLTDGAAGVSRDAG